MKSGIKKGTALITGASSGIGYELARCFAEEGHNVILVSRNQGELRAIADDFEATYGIQAMPLAKDLFNCGAPQEIYDEIQQARIRVDFLVNDAGQGVYGKFAETSLEKELDTIQLNVVALTVLTKLFLKDMLKRNEGRILQVASLVSRAPTPYAAVYSATKGFVYNLAVAISSELEGTNVTMTTLRPGATATAFFNKAHAEEMRLIKEGKLGPADKVARDGYEALMRGDTVVVSGLPNKIQAALAEVLPEKVLTKRTKKMHEPTAA
jgi:uncharacterized protein